MYPPIEPYEHGMLDVGDGNQIYWEVSGNPDGKPAVSLHGGPGGRSNPRMRQVYDPELYRVVIFDQRGTGRSTPRASDPSTDMRFNTTARLIADMEALRTHLGIDTWLLRGGSWGTSLALAYAEQYPERVWGIVLSAITTTRRSEIDWLYRGAGQFFPEDWARFRDGVPESERDGNLPAAYARLMDSPDLAVRERAATLWCAWEDRVLSLEPNAKPDVFSGRPSEAMIDLVRICSHYYANTAWFEDGQLIRDAGRLAGIPGALIHGRQDLSCPATTAWELAAAWPDAELHILDDCGHQGSESKRVLTLEILDRFAKL
jgi:proline iminopeptidase